MKRIRYRLLGFAALIIFVASPACDKKKHQSKIMTAVIALTTDIKSFDPSQTVDAASWRVLASIYEPLYQYSYLASPYKLEPLLAKDLPTFSKGGKELTVRLRADVSYQDDKCFVDNKGKGRKISAEDFVLAIKRIADPRINSPAWWMLDGRIVGLDQFRSRLKELDALEKPDEGARATHFLSKVEGVHAPDNHTLVFKLNKAYPQFVYLLAMPFTSPIPREALDKYANKEGTISSDPVGTGPFQLLEWEHGKKIVLERNDRFHADFYPTKGHEKFRRLDLFKESGKILPVLDRARIEIVSDPDEAIDRFENGEIDVLEDFSGTEEKLLALKKKGATVQKTEGLNTEFLIFNLNSDLFGRNKTLRQAISSAIDRETYVKKFANRRISVLNTPLPRGITEDSHTSKAKYHYDLERAKVLLAQAGYAEGKGLPSLRLEMKDSDRLNRDLGQFFIEQFEKIGIRLSVVLNSYPAYLEKLKKGRFQFAVGGWTLDYPDPENLYQLLYGPNRAPGLNYSGFDFKPFNDLFNELITLSPSDTRSKILDEMESIIMEEVPWALLSSRQITSVTQPWLKNFRASEVIYNRIKYLRSDSDRGR